jgi:hypothetical protein
MSNGDPAAALSQAYFESLVDFGAASQRVSARLEAIDGGEQLTRFFVHYAAWNGRFANGVSALVSLIGDSRELFQEAGFPRAVADRSNYIASYIFDAARDEYNDHINPIRDTHRCMAQASLISMSRFYELGDRVLDETDPAALVAVNDAVVPGYTGRPRATADKCEQIFYGLGYHLGSELLADREFSIIDEYLRGQQPELVHHLMRSTIELAGGKHRCYAWVGVHSGHGGGVEADHFEYALAGARSALKFLVGADANTAVAALAEGFVAFERDHARFFAIDNA